MLPVPPNYPSTTPVEQACAGKRASKRLVKIMCLKRPRANRRERERERKVGETTRRTNRASPDHRRTLLRRGRNDATAAGTVRCIGPKGRQPPPGRQPSARDYTVRPYARRAGAKSPGETGRRSFFADLKRLCTRSCQQIMLSTSDPETSRTRRKAGRSAVPSRSLARRRRSSAAAGRGRRQPT